MPTWGVLAQLSLSAVTVLVALAVYRVQADKLFLEFRDKRAQALDAFVIAAHARLHEISALSASDLLNAIDPDKLAGSNAEVWRTASVLRTWFGAEVGVAMAYCDTALNKAFDAKCTWLGTPHHRVQSFDRISSVVLEAYSSVQRVADAAAPYLHVDRRGLTMPQRIRGVWRHFRQ